MKKSSEIKAIARNSLKGNWKKAIIVYLIYFIILNGITYFSSFKNYPNLFQYFKEFLMGNYSGLAIANSFLDTILYYASLTINFFFYGVFTYGITSFFLNLNRSSRQAKVDNILDGFKKYGKCLSASTLNFIFIAGWFLLTLICFSIISLLFMLGLSLIFTFFALSSSSNQLLQTFIITVFMLILIIGFYFTFFILISRYSFIYYLMKDCETNSVMDYIRQSKIMMNGNYKRYIYLSLSFLGWIILSFITFSIASIYVVPYYKASMAVFYEEVLNDAIIKGKMNHVYLNRINTDTNNTNITYTI